MKELNANRRPTQRALDAGDSARFTSIFVASSFFCSQAESTPAPAPVTQTVGPPSSTSLAARYLIQEEVTHDLVIRAPKSAARGGFADTVHH